MQKRTKYCFSLILLLLIHISLYPEIYLYFITICFKGSPSTPCIQQLSNLFKTSGYHISNSEKRLFSNHQADYTYGEILLSSTDTLIHSILDLSHNDVLYDLGSGIGKFIIQSFITTNITKAVGIELSPKRHYIALSTLSNLISLGYISPSFISTRTITFIQDDFFNIKISDATVIYICSTLFSQQTMNRLYHKIIDECHPGTRILTTSPFSSSKLVLSNRYKLSFTWSNEPSTCYLYHSRY